MVFVEPKSILWGHRYTLFQTSDDSGECTVTTLLPRLHVVILKVISDWTGMRTRDLLHVNVGSNLEIEH